MTAIKRGRVSLVAATRTEDMNLKTIYIAAAKNVAAEIERDLDDLKRLIDAAEKELARVHGDPRQLQLGETK